MILAVYFLIQTISGIVYFETKPLANVLIKSENRVITRTNALGQFSFQRNDDINAIIFELEPYAILRIDADKLGQSMNIYLSKKQHFVSDTLHLHAKRPDKFQKVSQLSSITQRKLSVGSISKESIKRYLEIAPEIHVQESSGHGAAPVYKGFRANKLLYTIDGVRFNNAFFKSGNTPYMSLLNPLYFNSIAIAEGAVSIAYGSDAIGGSINFSNDLNVNDSLLIRSQFSSADETMKYGFKYNFSSQYSNHLLSFYRVDAGDRTVGDNGPQSIKNLDIQKTYYQQNNFDYHYIYSKEKSSIKLSLHLAEQNEASDFYRTYFKGSDRYEYDPLFWLMTKLSYDYDLSNHSDLNLTLYYQQFQEHKKELDASTRYSFDDMIHIYGFNSNFITSFDQFNLMSGIDLIFEESETEGFRNSTRIASKYPDNAAQFQTALFSTLTAELFSMTELTLGARLSYTKSNIPVQNAFIEGLDKLDAYDKNFSSLIYNIGLKHYYRNNSFQLNYFTAFRNPNFDDLAKTGEISKSVIFLPNYDIHSEKSKSIHFNFSHLNEDSRLDIGIFYTAMDDLIEANKTTHNGLDTLWINGETYRFEHNENIGQAEMFGFSLNYLITISKLRFQTGFSYQFGENLLNKNPLSKIPAFKMNMRLAYQFNEAFDSGVDFIYTAKQDRLSQSDLSDPRFINTGTPAFSRYDIFSSYQFKDIKLEVELENIFNKLYRIHGSALNGRGRSLNFGLEYGW